MGFQPASGGLRHMPAGEHPPPRSEGSTGGLLPARSHFTREHHMCHIEHLKKPATFLNVNVSPISARGCSYQTHSHPPPPTQSTFGAPRAGTGGCTSTMGAGPSGRLARRWRCSGWWATSTSCGPLPVTAGRRPCAACPSSRSGGRSSSRTASPATGWSGGTGGCGCCRVPPHPTLLEVPGPEQKTACGPMQNFGMNQVWGKRAPSRALCSLPEVF